MRVVLMGLAAGMLAGAMTRAEAQSASVTLKRKQEHARRETNASRQARIQRTIDETYDHRWEVFGGGGYLRWTSGQYTKRNNEISWATQANYFLSQKLSIIGDARGSFGNAHTFPINNTYGVYNPQINEYFFQGGAGYRFYRTEKIAVTAQALGGTVWGIFSGGAKGLQGTQLGLWQDGFKPAFSVAIAADYNFFPNLAFRVTPTYQATTFGGQVQNNVGVNAGIVYRFGRQ